MKSLYAHAHSALSWSSHRSFPLRPKTNEETENERKRRINELSILANKFGRKRMKIADDKESVSRLTIKIKKHTKHNDKILGICCKWDEDENSRRRVSQIQIATSKAGYCVLFNLVKLNGVPKELKILLEDEYILKVGLGTATYAKYLESDFSINLNSFLDIRYLAIHAKTTIDDIYEMAYKTFGFDMRELAKRTEKSNWTTKYLTADQIHLISYECLASYELYHTYNQLYTNPAITLIRSRKQQTVMRVPENKYPEIETFSKYFLNMEYNQLYSKLVPLLLKNKKYISGLRTRDLERNSSNPKVFPSPYYADILKLNRHVYETCVESLISITKRREIFQKKFEVINTPEECTEVVDKLYGDINLNKYRFLGIDCKYETCGKSRRPVALLQLCTMSTFCAVFKLTVIKEIPSALKQLLEDRTIMKVGFNTAYYWNYLKQDYGIQVHSILDIQYLARLLNYEFTDLVSLAQIVRKDLSSDGRNDIAPQWNVPSLTPKQLNWALNDVVACLKIAKEMTNRIKKRYPEITRQHLLNIYNSFLNLEYSYFYYEVIKELVINYKFLPAIKQKVGKLTFLQFEGEGPRYSPDFAMKKAMTILMDLDYIQRTTGQPQLALDSLAERTFIDYSLLSLDDSLGEPDYTQWPHLRDPAANLDDNQFDGASTENNPNTSRNLNYLQPEYSPSRNVVAPAVVPSDPPLNLDVPTTNSVSAVVDPSYPPNDPTAKLYTALVDLNISEKSDFSIIGNDSCSSTSVAKQDNLNISQTSEFSMFEDIPENIITEVVYPSIPSLHPDVPTTNSDAPVADQIDPPLHSNVLNRNSDDAIEDSGSSFQNETVSTAIQLYLSHLNSSRKLNCYLVGNTTMEDSVTSIVDSGESSLNLDVSATNSDVAIVDPDGSPLNQIVSTTIQLHPSNLNSLKKLDCFVVGDTATGDAVGAVTVPNDPQQNACVPTTSSGATTADDLPKGCWVLYRKSHAVFEKVRDIEEDKLGFYTHFAHIKPVSESEINS